MSSDHDCLNHWNCNPDPGTGIRINGHEASPDEVGKMIEEGLKAQKTEEYKKFMHTMLDLIDHDRNRDWKYYTLGKSMIFRANLSEELAYKLNKEKKCWEEASECFFNYKDSPLYPCREIEFKDQDIYEYPPDAPAYVHRPK